MSNEFTHRFAIQLPNGELLMQPTDSGLFGSSWKLLGLGEPPAAADPKPRTWDTREAAEAALGEIRRDLARKGVEWLAVVVQQLCTPFTVVDPAEHFAGEVQSWLDQQGGVR